MNWTEIFSKFKYKRHCKGGGGEGVRERAGCLTSAVRVTLAGGIEKASHAPDKSRWRQHFFKFMLRCNICVRRRRTHTNRLVFTEITFEGFMDQSQRDRSWCPAISATGIHVQMFPWPPWAEDTEFFIWLLYILNQRSIKRNFSLKNDEFLKVWIKT